MLNLLYARLTMSDSTLTTGNAALDALRASSLESLAAARADAAGPGARTQASGGGDWNGDWFDADASGARLPITLSGLTPPAGGGDIGALADGVVAHVGG